MFHYLPLDGGGREGLGVVVVAGPAVYRIKDNIMITLVNMILSYTNKYNFQVLGP